MKKTAIYIMIFISIMNCATLGSEQVYAHNEMLDVVYNDCTAQSESDGVHEIWYLLNDGDEECHIGHETLTIKYYFEQPINGDPDQYWMDCGINSELAADIREAYANSMKKWNNVYFYSYLGENQIAKHKIVNVVEGTYSDHNLSIYPSNSTNGFASTQTDSLKQYVELGEIEHVHYSKWRMDIHVDHFYVHDNRSLDHVNLARSRTGAHELGHVLGLFDVDLYCSPGSSHHEELLMGYGTLALRSTEITYKDIAGVAITRGLHTDSDHKWLKCGNQQSDGTYKLLCSICNGVKYVTNLNGYEYEEYYKCNGVHGTGNMMAVASYKNTDYFKCKYCECVAPFEANKKQNYSTTKIDETYHKVTNNVSWLNYEFIEEHHMINNECLTCLYNHSHSFIYAYINGRSHKRECYCGNIQTEAHSVLYEEIINGRYATCLGCNTSLDLSKDNAFILHGITNMQTSNGSYILPNGIVVLVQADLEAYENGTLQFYNVGDQTQTE